MQFTVVETMKFVVEKNERSDDHDQPSRKKEIVR